jgi:hypothetical protein
VNDIYPQLRAALVDAAYRHFQAADSNAAREPSRSSRRLKLHSLPPLMRGASAAGLAATVAAALWFSAGGGPTAAQAFPILASPATEIGSHPSLAKALAHAVSADGLPTFRSIHAFSTPNFTGGVSQVTVGGAAMICVGFTNRDGSSARVGCSATANAEQQGIVLTDHGEFVVLVPAGGSVDLTTGGVTTAVPVDSDGVASGVVDQNATLTIHVGNSVTTQQLAP